MNCCISRRGAKPLTLLLHVERWLNECLREAIESRRDAEALGLLAARDRVRRALQELLGPSPRAVPVAGLLMLIRVDARLTEKLAQVREKRRGLEAFELREAREIVRRLLAETAESLNTDKGSESL
jgi:hypothetical protein